MRIALHAYRPEFLEAAYGWRNEPLTRAHNPLGDVSREATAQFFESEASSFDSLYSHAHHRWFLNIDGALVGTISLSNVNPLMGIAELGYMLGEEFHGRGYATAGLRFFFEHLFRRSPLRRLTALVHEDNLASRRVLEKVGFLMEGILREHYVIQGTPVNEIAYGLLKNDWISEKAPLPYQ